MVETSRGFVRYRSARTFEASAYTLAEGSGTGLTSTGVVPYHGIVAVDPDVIPYGTRMYIPGYGLPWQVIAAVLSMAAGLTCTWKTTLTQSVGAGAT